MGSEILGKTTNRRKAGPAQRREFTVNALIPDAPVAPARTAPPTEATIQEMATARGLSPTDIPLAARNEIINEFMGSQAESERQRLGRIPSSTATAPRRAGAISAAQRKAGLLDPRITRR